MKITIGRKSGFEMAHVLRNALTKECNETVHGHSYKMEISLTGDICAETGMLLDYSVLKEAMCEIESVLDHALWVPKERAGYYKSSSKKLLATDFDPSAEMMCGVILRSACEALLKHNNMCYILEKISVVLKETENSYAMMEYDALKDAPAFPIMAEINEMFPSLWDIDYVGESK